MTKHIRPSELRRAMHFAHQLAVAAYACQINFDWLSANRYRQITMLDFDVIAGALPTVMTRKMLTERKDSYRKVDTNSTQLLKHSFDFLSGPHTLRLYLDNLREFTVPHGAASELLSWKHHISGSLTQRSRQLLDRLEGARNADDPATFIMNKKRGGLNIFQVLQEELNAFDDDLDDLVLLDHVLDRATPIEELISERRETSSSEVFRTIYSYLQARRPNKSNNNLSDAINVSQLVRLLNAPTDRNRVPVLISQTRSVAEFPIDHHWLNFARNQNAPGFIQDELYLVVMQSLLSFCENRYPNVVDEASLLQMELNDLADAYGKLLSEVESKESDNSQYAYAEELVQDKLEAFQKYWIPVFQPVTRSNQLDRAMYMNMLLKPEVVRRLASDQPEEVRQGIQNLIEELQSYRHPLFDTQGQTIGELGNNRDDLQDKIGKLFRLSWRQNDGMLLAKTERGTPIGLAGNLGASDDIRYILHPTSLSVGAVLAFDMWQSPETPNHRRLAVIWPHRANVLAIWREGVRLLQASLAPASTNEVYCSCMILTNSKRSDETDSGGLEVEVTLDAAEDVLINVLKDSNDVEYFELHAGPFTFFADAHPLENIEMQAGIGLTQECWSKAILQAIATAVCQTSTLSLSTQQYVKIIQFITYNIGLSQK